MKQIDLLFSDLHFELGPRVFEYVIHPEVCEDRKLKKIQEDLTLIFYLSCSTPVKPTNSWADKVRGVRAITFNGPTSPRSPLCTSASQKPPESAVTAPPAKEAAKRECSALFDAVCPPWRGLFHNTLTPARTPTYQHCI